MKLLFKNRLIGESRFELKHFWLNTASESQSGSSQSRADSSKPAVENYWLSVDYVAMISVKPISAMGQRMVVSM
ncbi:MAG: hypothetical protein Q7K57_26270 [Burkholderiaceae bacterium]|nr:hypothetical protein [Burkholderiaceae bacterium]